MKLTEQDRIKITRLRLGLKQCEFYDGICDQQMGSYIEIADLKNSCKSFISTYNRILKTLNEKYDLAPKNIKIGELAKILRIKDGDSIRNAGKSIGRSHVWVIAAEKGKYFGGDLYELYWRKVNENKN